MTHNPHRDDPLQVKPFGKIYALSEGLGVISLHRTKTDAEYALANETERRRLRIEAVKKLRGTPK
jgi:hypothetical protein